MAPHQKKVRELRAILAFTDETGFLLAPLARRSLSRRGHTPILRPSAGPRDKVSVATALTLSPVRGHISLYYQTYPDLYVDTDLYAHFLRNLLWQVQGPVVLLHDGGPMHKGPPLRAVLEDFARLHLHPFPPYAPELNPPEQLWNYVKYHRLGNFIPLSTAQIETAACAELEAIRHDQHRLRSFFLATPLSWQGTSLLL